MSRRNGSSRRWRELREQVLERDGRVCQLGWPGCTVDATHVDHVVPVSAGGSDSRSNLRAACASCNLRRGDGRRRGRSLTAGRTPLPPVFSLSPRDTVRTRHAELDR